MARAIEAHGGQHAQGAEVGESALPQLDCESFDGDEDLPGGALEKSPMAGSSQ